MNTIRLIVGDWSGDGHNQTETVVVECNLTRTELFTAHNAGCEKLGIAFDNVCADYEDNFISKDVWDKLEAAGLTFEDLPDQASDSYYARSKFTSTGQFPIWINDYAYIYMFIARQGNPELDYHVITDDKTTIQIGGYGLFV